MKKMRKLLITGMLMTLAMTTATAANTDYQRSSTLNDTLVITKDQNLILKNAKPFGDLGVVNLVNTEHAVLILEKVKPKDALRLIGAHVQIDGKKANPDRNCQVKLYNRGTIIMPYAPDFQPLTVYSEQNFMGEAVNDFGLENTGGFMNTLTDEKLNNRIRSFKLKRGYMVTFSTRPGGRGYSRCFIAANADYELKVLPDILDQKITSYRIFKWYDTGKPQLAAAGGDAGACDLLNVTSTYTWGGTSDMAPNQENVPHHIYENYPSPSSLGSCTTSPHMKTNNEPMNTADDPKGQTEDVNLVLSNWEDLMATGMRLCSPSSWDGSDYTNGTGYIKRFIDSIDARGWRCDIIDLHCYWPESNFGTIRNWTNSTGRPVWISEWVWGASWNNNGAFASNVTEAQNAAALKRICPVLNQNDCIERYYYWNGERDPSRLIKGSTLTEAGEYYATIDAGLGYNGKYEKIPTTPRQYAPGRIEVITDPQSGCALVQWQDNNGEYSRSVQVERSRDGGTTWEVAGDAQVADGPSLCSFVDSLSQSGDVYRVHQIDFNKKHSYTKTVTYTTEVYTRPVQSADGWGTICLKNGIYPMTGTLLYEVVGVTPDLTAFCMNPIDHVEAGYPAVYHTDSLAASFIVYGDKVLTEKYGASGLIGQFDAYPLEGGCIYLKDGEWWVVPDGEEPPLGAYEACFADHTELVIQRDWTGLTMPVHGLPDDTSIRTLTASTASATWYTLDGRQVLAPARGIYIKVQGGQISKVVVR
ncbi:MAG: hypothetical protein IKQ05_06160 [Prevotella sp.]|nr:hypothetical protein [Prevotella sp.]